MKLRKSKNEALDQAEDLLLELRTLRSEIRIIELQAEIEINTVRQRFQDSLTLRREALADREKELMGLMKKEKASVFDGRDKVELIHGFLFYETGFRVSIPRDAVKKIEAAGWADEAIRIAKSVDRKVVESWPDKRLEAIGAKKKPVENFSYELKAIEEGT